ncbi:hypothetical protein ACFU6I_08090 [Streptomyces sp. NPDC057486]|uniref:hypothetical protein n=1 Tax=Streptomyces sp. NPDC057486 TaxID=3346145 RepID=UPI00369FC4EC
MIENIATAASTQSEAAVREVLHIGEDAAVVISRSGILSAGESTIPADRFVLATWVLAKEAGQGAGEGWLVAAYHNCPAGKA